jgi:nucleotide-binding universal stress UspA family protein
LFTSIASAHRGLGAAIAEAYAWHLNDFRVDGAMHEVIVVCVDGSPGGYAAVAEAAELARRFAARLIALSVEEGLPKYAATIGEVDEFKREKDTYYEVAGAEAKAIAQDHGVALTHEVRLGHAAGAIVRFVDEVGADLVVLGHKGHSRIAAFVIGSTAQKVSAHSPASVLMVRAERHRAVRDTLVADGEPGRQHE